MSTAPRRPDLANEPVGRLMLRLSIPTITAQLVNMLYNLVDRIYISYIPDVGTLALTGLGVCLPIILLVSAFAALCASSGAPLASIAMGQRNNEKAEGILGSCTALLLCVSAVLTVVLSCFYTPILLAFGATEDALPYAQRYIAIYSLGTVFVQLSLGLNPFITAQGFSKAGMLTMLIGAVLNTLLDPLFIFVFHMDVQGAALATVISQAVSAAFVLRFLTGRQTILHLKRRLLRLNWKLLAPCVALGLAPFIMQSTESLVSVCFNTSLRAAGGTLAVGTMTICSTLMQFALLPLQGLSQGAQPIISFNYGAKRPERVKAAFRILLISCLAFSAVLGLTCIFAPQIFVYLLTPDAALREYAIPCVRLYMAGVTIFGAQIACQQTFVALGNAKCSLFLACLRKLILLIPLVYLLPLFIPDSVCDFPRRTDCGCFGSAVHGDAVHACVQKDNARHCGVMALSGTACLLCRDFAPAGATRGLCDRPLDPFAVHISIVDFYRCAGISLLREQPKRNENRRSLRSSFGNLRRGLSHVS